MKTYEFDFESALGDTIMEKYEAFYLKLREVNQEEKINFVVGSEIIVSLFETATAGFTFVNGEEMGSIVFAGSLNMGFEIYKSSRVACDELVCFRDKENACLKFTNFLI